MSPTTQTTLSVIAGKDRPMDYSLSRKVDEKEYITTIDLTDTTLEQRRLAANRTTTFGLKAFGEPQSKEFVVAAADLHRSGFKDEHLRIITQQRDETAASTTAALDRWLHVHTDHVNRETFEKLALNFVLKHDEDLVPVVLSVLEEVWSNYEEQSAYGSHLRPGAVWRCDGTDAEQSHKPDLSATFISFPYFDAGTGPPSYKSKEYPTQLSRGLFENAYPHEATHNRDADQMFRKFKRNRKKQHLRVSQLWALVLRSRTIITCSSSPLPEMFHGVEFVAANDLLVKEPGRIHVTDHLRRVMYLPLETCTTFFGLRRTLEEHCFRDTETTIDDCIITGEDSCKELNAIEWPDLLKFRMSPFIYVRLHPKTKTTREVSGGGGIQLESPKVTRLIEYESLDSDDDDDDARADDMALVLSKHHVSDHDDQPHPLTAIQERLRREGYVVNNVESLMFSENVKERPRIFDRPDSFSLRNNTRPRTNRLLMSAEDEIRSEHETSGILVCQNSRPLGNKFYAQGSQERHALDATSKSSLALSNGPAMIYGPEHLIPGSVHSSLELNDYDEENLRQDLPRRLEECRSSPTRVAKEDLEIETLLEFEIPYEYDQNDPSYLILPSTDSEVLQALLAHTAQLRSARKEEEEKNSQFNVPPFLAWPTSIVDKSSDSTGDPDHQSPRNQPSSGYLLEHSLYAIEEHMTRARSNLATLPIDPEHPYMFLYRKGTAFTEVPEVDSHDLVLNLMSFSRADISDIAHPSDLVEFEIMTWLMDSTHALSEETTEDLTLDGYDTQRLLESTCCTARRSTQWHTTLMLEYLRLIVLSAIDVVDQVVPKHYPHTLLRRCWGSLQAIVKVVTLICRMNHTHQQKDYDSESLSVFVLRDVPSKEYAELYRLEDLVDSLDHCSMCKRKTHYTSVDEAVQHLMQFHVSKSGQKLEHIREKLTHWVVSASGADLENSNQLVIRYLNTLSQQIEMLQTKLVDLRNSVANENNEKPEGYLLPSALVKAAENFFQILFTSQYSVKSLCAGLLYNRNTRMTASDITKEVETHITLIEHFGSRASTQISSARHALLLMANIGTVCNSVVSIHSPPELTLLLCCIQLSKRPIDGDLCVLTSYQEHLSSMRYQASHRPRKHDLRDLYLLEEELELVEAIYDAQRLALKTYGKVIDHGSYRITNRERVQTNENIERRILNRYLVEKPLPGLRYDYKDLQNQLTKTAQVLRYGIEIAEEGNTKAIRVFTLVTIIFLPLSFISSVFGMNTVDIRDMENTQGLFWATAIPTTALIGGLSLLIAYRGTQMWDWLQNQSHTVHVNVAGTILDRRAYVKRRKQRPNDEEVLAGDDEELVERWMHGLHTKRRTGVRR